MKLHIQILRTFDWNQDESWSIRFEILNQSIFILHFCLIGQTNQSSLYCQGMWNSEGFLLKIDLTSSLQVEQIHQADICLQWWDCLIKVNSFWWSLQMESCFDYQGSHLKVLKFWLVFFNSSMKNTNDEPRFIQICILES